MWAGMLRSMLSCCSATVARGLQGRGLCSMTQAVSHCHLSISSDSNELPASSWHCWLGACLASSTSLSAATASLHAFRHYAVVVAAGSVSDAARPVDDSTCSIRGPTGSQHGRHQQHTGQVDGGWKASSSGRAGRARSGTSWGSSTDSHLSRDGSSDSISGSGSSSSQGGSRGGQQASARSGGAKAISPPLLTSRIKQTTTPQHLQQVIQQYKLSMNCIHIAAAVTQLGQWKQRGQIRTPHGHNAAMQLLCELEQMLQPQLLKACGTRGLANIVWACGYFSYTSLQQACIPEFVKKLSSDASPQAVANVLWGLARSGEGMGASELQLVLDSLVTPGVLDVAKPQNISNTLWAVATMEQQVPPQQLQQLLDAFAKQLLSAKPQEISNTLWAVATMQQQVPPQQLQQLLAAFAKQLPSTKPQNISNTLWAVTTMEQQVPPQQLKQLLAAFAKQLPSAKPQAISNTLWAVATMQQQVPPQQTKQLLEALVSQLLSTKPQDISNTLWAVATTGQQVPPQQLQQLLAAFAKQLPSAKPQAISNTLWACATLRHPPTELLSALCNYQHLKELLSASLPQHVSNMALACAKLGYRNELLLGPLLQQAIQQLGDKGGSMSSSSSTSTSSSSVASKWNSQDLCNLCWSVAVLDLQQYADQLLLLVKACSKQWGSLVDKNMCQLQQVHLWLLGCQLAGGLGLLGALTSEQLQQCQEAAEADLKLRQKQPPNQLQREVFAVLQQLLPWQQQPVMEHLSQPDGALLIDITAVTADGLLLAIEVDGPTHFMTNGQLTGETLFRNRALAARGYTVVSVPYFEWRQQQGLAQQQQYLMGLIDHHTLQQQHSVHGSSST